jgi:2-C-methyl-D-erythritol 2,4-cyclodiphosphate synthase
LLVGIGFDVHVLKKGEKMTIGGVLIDTDFGLLGHSDADVLTHALIDALLGATGKGDIGQHFPDQNDEYKDISSLILLQRVFAFIEGTYSINNIDLIIIAEKPKMTPYYHAIKENYSQILKLDLSKINLKSTTTEGLGFVGKGEGIAAQAIVSLSELKRG